MDKSDELDELNSDHSEKNKAPNGCKTPEKEDNSQTQTNDSPKVLTPIKEQNKCEPNIFTTPKKITPNNKSVSDAVEKRVRSDEKTPEKTCENLEVTCESKTESESYLTNDGEEDLISTTEQARLLIAASKTPSKTPSKSTYKTPVKNGTPTGKRSVENSPYTPGKHKRVDLVTLSSPKVKRLKQI